MPADASPAPLFPLPLPETQSAYFLIPSYLLEQKNVSLLFEAHGLDTHFTQLEDVATK